MDRYRFPALALGALLLSACSQADGESCQLPSDCDDGLICCNSGMFGRFGTCATTCPSTGVVDAGSLDSAVVQCLGGDGTPASLMNCGLETDYCAAAACGAAGSCVDAPTECAAVLDPVCGCDGASYLNPCEANRAQVTVDPTGAACVPGADGGVDGGSDAGTTDAGTVDAGMATDAGNDDAGTADAG